MTVGATVAELQRCRWCGKREEGINRDAPDPKGWCRECIVQRYESLKIGYGEMFRMRDNAEKKVSELRIALAVLRGEFP